MNPSLIFFVVFAIAGSACNALPVYGEPINHLFKRGNVGSKSQRAQEGEPVAHAPAPDSTHGQVPQHMFDHILALQASHNSQRHGAQEHEPVAHAPAHDSTQAPLAQHMLNHIQASHNGRRHGAQEREAVPAQASHNGQHHGAQEREAVPAQAPQHTLDRIQALQTSVTGQRAKDHCEALDRYLEAQENPPPHPPPGYDGRRC